MCTGDKSKEPKGQACARMGWAAPNKVYFPRVQGKAAVSYLILGFMIL